ncbi:MAG: hypothetical protein JRG73_05825 [Deltaproteobacteria bacterium]|nr:hypothetical protein [Deltaproteobacteria bacterium]MBW2306440.1 hypothetical protein [Deltaproteobacteria bacterium]
MNVLNAYSASHTRFDVPHQGPAGVISSALWLGVFFIATLMLVGGCGRKGNPLPPFRHESAAVRDLRAGNRPEGILLWWSIPRLEGKGNKIKKFRVLRAEGTVSCTSCPGEWTPVAEVRLDSPLPARRSDGQIQLLDYEISDGMVYQYRVISMMESGAMSPPSNTVEILRRID